MPARRLSRTAGGHAARASSGRAAGARRRPARRRSRSGSGTRGAAATSRSSRVTTAPSSTSECPPRYFVALCSTRSAPWSSGREVDRRRGGRVDDDRRRVRGGGLEVGHRQERIRRRLEPDELHAVGRRPGLVELHVLEAPARELPEERRRAVVAALGDRDRVARPQERQDDRGRRAGARREEKRLAALELARARARRRLRSGARSAGSRTRRARRPRTARASSGRAAAVPRRDCTSLLRRGRARDESTQKKLEQLEQLRDEALHAGSEKAVERQRAAGQAARARARGEAARSRARSSSSTATCATEIRSSG